MKPIIMIWSLVFLYLVPYRTYSQTICDTAIGGIEVNLSLSSNCRLEIEPLMVTSNYNPDYQYQFTVMTEEGDSVSAPLTGKDIGKSFLVMLTSDSCNTMLPVTSKINIEDKVKPTLNCPDTVIECVDFIFYDPVINIHDCQDVQVDILSQVIDTSCIDTLATKMVRTYRVTDGSGNTATCEQEFLVKRFNLNNDVEYPPSEVEISCEVIETFLDAQGNIKGPPTGLPVGTGSILQLYPFGVPTASGSPLNGLNFAECGVRAYYKSLPTTVYGCKTTYRREWRVYEWHCSGETVGPPFIQKIVVIDTTPPEFSFSKDTLFFNAGAHTCTVDIPFSSLGMSDPVDGNACTSPDELEIEIAVFDYGNLAGINDTIKNIGVDTLLVKVSISDRCHQNTTVDSVTVIVLDKTPPQPICPGSLQLQLPDPGGARIPSNYFDVNSYDACGSYGVDARRMEDIVFSDSVSFFCGDVGTDVMVVVRFTDEVNNAHTCMVAVSVLDSLNICPPSPFGLWGTVKYENNEPIPNNLIRVIGQEYRELYTDGDGRFVLEDYPAEQPFTILPEKDDKHSMGISTYDVILMQKHVLGLESLDSPYKVIAADVNGNGRINASDIFELRRLILADVERFASNTSFVFIPSEMNFIDPSEPWLNGDIFGQKIWPGVSPAVIDLMAIKVGDINKSTLSSTGRSNRPVFFTYAIEDFGGEIKVKVYNSETVLVEGFQTSIQFNEKSYQFKKIENGQMELDNGNYSLNHLSKGQIPFSWNGIKEVELGTNTPLFSMVFQKRGIADLDLNFADMPTPSEVYLNDAPYPLRIKNKTEHSMVLNNIPNPWSGNTEIHYSLPGSAPVSVNIYDASMRRIWTKNCLGKAGSNVVEISSKEIIRTGVYFYEVIWNGGRQVSKMIRL